MKTLNITILILFVALAPGARIVGAQDEDWGADDYSGPGASPADDPAESDDWSQGDIPTMNPYLVQGGETQGDAQDRDASGIDSFKDEFEP